MTKKARRSWTTQPTAPCKDFLMIVGIPRPCWGPPKDHWECTPGGTRPPPPGRTGSHRVPQDVTKDVLNSELVLKHQKQQGRYVCLHAHTHICISMYVGIAMSRKKPFLFPTHLSNVKTDELFHLFPALLPDKRPISSVYTPHTPHTHQTKTAF